MNKSTKIILALLVVLAAACAAALLLKPKGTDRPVARITVNGTLVNEVDLTSSSLPQTFTSEGPGGFANTIVAELEKSLVERLDARTHQDLIDKSLTKVVLK